MYGHYRNYILHFPYMLPLLAGIFGVGLGRFIFQYTKELTFDTLSTTIATDMRRDLFAHIQSLSTEFFDRTQTGELMARVKDDIDKHIAYPPSKKRTESSSSMTAALLRKEMLNSYWQRKDFTITSI